MTTYHTLDADGLRRYLWSTEALRGLLGSAVSASEWDVREVSDGNLNMVFVVRGPAGSVCCKQSLPHVRVDPTWRMPLDRTAFEARYMRAVAPYVGHQTPALLHYDGSLYLIVMENLDGYEVLRGALNAGRAQAGFSARVGEYVAHTAFHTSWFSRPFEQVMADLAAFAANTTLTRITVDLVLTDPFRAGCTRNHWISPELDDIVAVLQTDRNLHRAVGRLQTRFLSSPQALLHGDLHTGSMMVHGDDLRVIDGEFALFGPIGFDLGLYIANLAMHGIAHPGHAEWMRDEIATTWDVFRKTYGELWRTSPARGDACALLDADARRQDEGRLLREILRDVAGFCGTEMIRRTIGYAQISDYGTGGDRAHEISARRRSLLVGRELILGCHEIEKIGQLLERL